MGIRPFSSLTQTRKRPRQSGLSGACRGNFSFVYPVTVRRPISARRQFSCRHHPPAESENHRFGCGLPRSSPPRPLPGTVLSAPRARHFRLLTTTAEDPRHEGDGLCFQDYSDHRCRKNSPRRNLRPHGCAARKNRLPTPASPKYWRSPTFRWDDLQNVPVPAAQALARHLESSP